MKVLLLQPVRIFKRWPIPEDFTALVASVPTLALAQLAATIPEHECRIVDGLWRDIPLAELLVHLRWADVVLVNAHSSVGSLNVEANLRFIKKHFPHKPVVLGGHHATAFAQQWLERGADVVVRGEGERTLPEVIFSLEHSRPFDNILGISWRRGSGQEVEYHRNPDRPLIEVLDETPMPRWELFDAKLYDLPLPAKGPATTIETSRGCNHACSFCAASAMWNHRQRFKSAERVVKEFETLYRLGYRKAWVVDDNYGVKFSRDLEIYEEIKKKGIDIHWMCFIRPDTVYRRPDVIAKAAEAGLRLALVGFEGPNEWELSDYGKNVKASIYNEVSKILRRNGIFIGGFFIVGYPSETISDSKRTFEEARKLADYPIISMFEPRQGTAAMEKAIQAGQVSDDRFYHNTQKPLLGQEEVLRLYRAFYRRFLFDPRRLLAMMDGTPVMRSYYRLLYRNLVRSVLDVSLERLLNPWEMVEDLREETSSCFS